MRSKINLGFLDCRSARPRSARSAAGGGDREWGYDSRESVPTWNYATVHAYDHGRIFQEPERVTEILLDTIATFEPLYLEQWQSLSEQLRASMLRQIVGFEIAVDRLEAKFKLSQNRTQADQSRIIHSLGTSENSAVSDVAKMMKDQTRDRRVK